GFSHRFSYQLFLVQDVSLRNYFHLRKHLGSDYLELLQFFLNHRTFMESRKPERLGKSPAELMTGEKHPHWLEMLGFARFQRA
ncbi:hypothetical protein, partial [Crocosphaera sp. Alani8]|uniref:hypothetical protein n=1 Tax=Crocosphaera sp. Alani8 TaxID=3038952 RepID=UPI00313AC0AF